MTHLEKERRREREEIMIVVTGAEHDTDRLEQSMTVNGYDLVSLHSSLHSVWSALSTVSRGWPGCQENTAIRPGVLR